MRQIAGVSVVLAVAMAAMRFVSSPQTSASLPIAPPAAHRSTAKKSDAKQTLASAYKGGCSVFDADDAPDEAGSKPDTNRGAAQSLIRRFFDLKDHENLRAKPNVRFAIALAPDPRHTNLSLIFDREMVAIQQAAQDQGYNYNSSWLPWQSDSSAAYALLEDQQRTEDDTGRREACPGLLVFRKSIRDLGRDTDLAHLHDAYDEALVVLVVGEQPTGGVNQTQWENAIAWLHENAYVPQKGSPQWRPLHILGPTFSGSLVSLQRDLATAARAPDDATVFPSASTPVRILSGSVSRCSTALWFRHTMQITRPTSPTSFGSFQQSDELEIFRFMNYLKEQRTELRDVAIVSEDETAYANSSAPEKGDLSATTAPCEFAYSQANSPVRLSFPRDISAMRSAYEKESLFTADPARGAHAVLQENVHLEGEASNVADTIPMYSGSFTPVAEEAVLYGLVSNLRAHHARYIVLRCTNPLDFLFLTRFFHRAYPEGRIVTVGSDLLFRREIDTTEFRGVLALSSYPLLPLEQHWSHVSARADDAPPIPHTHRIPESHMEGTYLAARYLFDNDEPESPFNGHEDPVILPFKENIPDFADPFWMHEPGETFRTIQAPIWLSIVGRDGYWPVAVLNERSTPDNCLNRIDKDEARPCNQSTQEKLAPPSAMVQIKGTTPDGVHVHYDRDPANPAHFHRYLRFSLPLSWEVFAVLATFLLIYQVFGVWQGNHFTSSGLFIMFRRVTTPSQAILIGVNTAFALSLLLQLLMTALELPNFTSVFKNSTEFAFFTLLWFVFLGFVLWRFIKGDSSAEHRLSNNIALASIAATLGFLIICAIWVWFVDRPIRVANALPLFFRMTHLTQGVSPLVPIMFLLLGFYLWTWQALAGNSLLCCGVPILPELDNASFPKAQHPWWQYWRSAAYLKLLGLPTRPRLQNGPVTLDKLFHRISHEVGKRIIRIASPACVDPEVIAFPLLLLISALVYLFNIGTPLLGLEGRAYAWIVNIALLVAFLLTIAEAARLFFTWKELQRLLTALSRLRLRRTFAKLRAVDSNSIWSVSGTVQRIQFHFFAQQLDAAQRLVQYPGGGLASVATAARVGTLFSRNSADKINIGPLWEMPVLDENGNSHKIREAFTDAVAEVLNDLIDHWRMETASLSLETSPAGNESETERNVFNLELSDDPIIRTQEEFVCFHYIAFIQNILARMRTMILSMVYLFVSICLAISFYPFVPRNSIGMWMLINLMFIAASVIYVYAGMERDETLSYITNTRSGRLSPEFYLKTAAFLAGPVIGLVTTQFPAISESVLGWLQPSLDALK